MKLLQSVKINGLVFEVYSDRPSFDFFEIKQIHGTKIVYSSKDIQEADGIIASSSESTLAIKTADCMPVAYIGNNNHALVHAGWRGLASGIITETKLIELTPKFIHIGPHIKKCCFEVSKDFHLNFINGENYYQSGTHFDLTTYATDSLKASFPNSIITVSDTCTSCNSKYNSYRRNNTDIRNYNILKNGE